VAAKVIIDIPDKAMPIWEDPRRVNTLYGGRGSTKSWTVAQILSLNGYREPRRILCGREIQKSLDESVFRLLRQQQHRMGLGSFYQEHKGGIRGLNGTEFIFKGLRTENIDSLKSIEDVDDCWLEEAHVLSHKSIRILVPSIRKPGSRFYVTLNPELDDDPAYERFVLNADPERSHAIKMNYNDNPWFKDTELEAERQYDNDHDRTPGKFMYAHVWDGTTLPAVEGAIFAGEVALFEQERRYRDIDIDPMGLVHGIMDLGWGVMTMVLAQRFASTVQVVGYREWRNATYDQITAELRADKQLEGVRWGKIFMPHDASHRDPKTGRSHRAVMRDLGWTVASVPQLGVENYIEKGRRLFRTAYINKGNGGDDLMRCLKRFKYKVAVDNEHKKTGVDKDDFSHGSEAWCYTAVVADELTNNERTTVNPYEGFDSGYAA
jgi:phage terminase large subunit